MILKMPVGSDECQKAKQRINDFHNLKQGNGLEEVKSTANQTLYLKQVQQNKLASCCTSTSR